MDRWQTAATRFTLKVNRLKVLHVLFTFAPEPVGGTEIFVEALARSGTSLGIKSVLAAPSCSGTDEVYYHNGWRVRRFRSAPESRYMLQELYGEGDPESATAFGKILDEECPDVVHIHAFTRAASIALVRVSKRRGIPVFFTYHTPTVSCQRGTLMLWGREVCDGVLNVRRCTGCSIAARGVARPASVLLSYVPSWLTRGITKANLSGGLWTALRMRELIRSRHEAFHALMREVDGIIVPKEWVRSLLVRNGVPDSKITLSPHGLDNTPNHCEPLIDVAKTPFRVAFLGRADEVKGIDTLIKAVRAAPDLRIELNLYGVMQSTADEGYCAMLKSLAGHDTRIIFFPAMPHDKIIPLLRGYHVLAVPSRCLETGPLVVLEAFAAGIPVIGSDLGGIAEWVRHEKNGLLVEANNIEAWSDALRRCAVDRQLLARLRESVASPRSMSEVAQEMAQLYSRHLNSVGRRVSMAIAEAVLTP
jgi:glycosyltransferase involved in cell wall biosynthesis